MSTVELTVLICTHNRASDLGELLDSIVNQTDLDAHRVEVVVVDNNSNDTTHVVVARARQMTNIPVRYVLEPRQGKAYALNRGLTEAAGRIIAIVDDDQLMPRTYLAELIAAFRGMPKAAFIGGKVLPMWQSPPPPWLTGDHWGPLGMLDHGDEPFVVNSKRPVCLLTCAFRREDLLAAGGYREQLGVSGGSIGSTEDADILERLWSTGRDGYYVPSLTLLHKAPTRRMTRAYHRRWHRGHGRFESLRRGTAVETSRLHVLGVPSHMYRQAIADLFGYATAAFQGRREVAFRSELRLCFFIGFAKHRYLEYARSCYRAVLTMGPGRVAGVSTSAVTEARESAKGSGS